MTTSLKTQLSVFGAAALLLGTSLAHCEDMHAAGKEYGKESLSLTAGAANNPVVKDPDFYIANPKQAAGYSSGVTLFSQGTTRINTCKTETPGSDKIANQECEAVNFLAKNPQERVRVEVDAHDPILVNARDIMANATSDPITDTVCVDKTTTDPDERSTEICHKVIVAEAKSCTVGRVIEVDSDSNFQCNQTYLAKEKFECIKTVEVNCAPPATGCGPNGIINLTATASGFGRYVLHPAAGSYYYLSFGTVATDGSYVNNLYFDGNYRNVFTGTYTFNIEDKSRVATFFLDQIMFDDNIAVWINGILLYHSAGGNDWVMGTTKYSCGSNNNETCTMSAPCRNSNKTGCSTDYFDGGANITSVGGSELKSYLVNGQNTVVIKVVIGKNGDAIARFRTLLYCEPSCNYGIDNQCATFEARAK